MFETAMRWSLPWNGPLLILILLLFAACDSGEKVTNRIDLSETTTLKSASPVTSPSARAGHSYAFGFDLRGLPSEDARQYLPFLKYLEQATGYEFQLKFTPKGQSTGDVLGRGEVQFAAIGATSFIAAHEKYGTVALVRGLNPHGKAEYQSMIVVARDSPISKLEQLRGKHLAFGSRDSTQGHLIPRILLGKVGIVLPDLASYDYTGSHSNCATAVISGKADACGMQDTMAKDLAKQGLLRILTESPYYPSSGIAANAAVPTEVTEKVKAALLAFEPEGAHKAGLYNWHKTEMSKGFTAASRADYADLRHWMIEFGMLQPKQAEAGANQ